MELIQHNVSDTGERVQTFLDAQKAAIGAAVPTALRARLDSAVAQARAAQVDEQTFAAGAPAEITKQKAIQKEVKVDLLGPIARVVRRAFTTNPDFQVMIVSSNVLRKGDFVGKVSAVADAAALHEQDLIDNGLPADVVARLRGAVVQFTASAAARGTQLGSLKQARQTLKDSTKAIRDVVHIIDGNMKRELKANQPLLANWSATRKIQATAVIPMPTGDLNVSVDSASAAAAAPAKATV